MVPIFLVNVHKQEGIAVGDLKRKDLLLPKGNDSMETRGQALGFLQLVIWTGVLSLLGGMPSSLKLRVLFYHHRRPVGKKFKINTLGGNCFWDTREQTTLVQRFFLIQ